MVLSYKERKYCPFTNGKPCNEMCPLFVIPTPESDFNGCSIKLLAIQATK